MAVKRVFIVFILPVILSIIVGSIVLSDILQKPDRELSMWPMPHPEENTSHSAPIEIIGLAKQYTTQEPVEIQVKIDDSSFN